MHVVLHSMLSWPTGCTEAGWTAILFGHGQTIKPAGLTPGLTSACLLLKPGKPAITSF